MLPIKVNINVNMNKWKNRKKKITGIFSGLPIMQKCAEASILWYTLPRIYPYHGSYCGGFTSFTLGKHLDSPAYKACLLLSSGLCKIMYFTSRATFNTCCHIALKIFRRSQGEASAVRTKNPLGKTSTEWWDGAIWTIFGATIVSLTKVLIRAPYEWSKKKQAKKSQKWCIGTFSPKFSYHKDVEPKKHLRGSMAFLLI